MVDQLIARDIGKTAVRDRVAPAGRPIAWRDVLRAASGNETRSYVVQRMRDAEFSADDFTDSRIAREVVADALTRIEDRLEHRGPKAQRERTTIRDARRALEQEIF